LKFNNEGTVYQEKYYKGERHVDNYFIDPRYLRWDVILMRVFDLAVEGQKIWADYKKLATKLAWRLDEYEED